LRQLRYHINMAKLSVVENHESWQKQSVT